MAPVDELTVISSGFDADAPLVCETAGAVVAKGAELETPPEFEAGEELTTIDWLKVGSGRPTDGNDSPGVGSGRPTEGNASPEVGSDRPTEGNDSPEVGNTLLIVDVKDVIFVPEIQLNGILDGVLSLVDVVGEPVGELLDELIHTAEDDNGPVLGQEIDGCTIEVCKELENVALGISEDLEPEAGELGKLPTEVDVTVELGGLGESETEVNGLLGLGAIKLAVLDWLLNGTVGMIKEVVDFRFGMLRGTLDAELVCTDVLNPAEDRWELKSAEDSTAELIVIDGTGEMISIAVELIVTEITDETTTVVEPGKDETWVTLEKPDGAVASGVEAIADDDIRSVAERDAVDGKGLSERDTVGTGIPKIVELP